MVWLRWSSHLQKVGDLARVLVSPCGFSIHLSLISGSQGPMIPLSVHNFAHGYSLKSWWFTLPMAACPSLHHIHRKQVLMHTNPAAGSIISCFDGLSVLDRTAGRGISHGATLSGKESHWWLLCQFPAVVECETAASAREQSERLQESAN